MTAKHPYKYLVSYFTDSGEGRIFISCDDPINTEAHIVAIEKIIRQDIRTNHTRVGITNFIRLEG